MTVWGHFSRRLCFMIQTSVGRCLTGRFGRAEPGFFSFGVLAKKSKDVTSSKTNLFQMLPPIQPFSGLFSVTNSKLPEVAWVLPVFCPCPCFSSLRWQSFLLEFPCALLPEAASLLGLSHPKYGVWSFLKLAFSNLFSHCELSYFYNISGQTRRKCRTHSSICQS